METLWYIHLIVLKLQQTKNPIKNPSVLAKMWEVAHKFSIIQKYFILLREKVFMFEVEELSKLFLLAFAVQVN